MAPRNRTLWYFPVWFHNSLRWHKLSCAQTHRYMDTFLVITVPADVRSRLSARTVHHTQMCSAGYKAIRRRVRRRLRLSNHYSKRQARSWCTKANIPVWFTATHPVPMVEYVTKSWPVRQWVWFGGSASTWLVNTNGRQCISKFKGPHGCYNLVT